MAEEGSLGLPEGGLFWLALYTMLLGALIVILLILFGLLLLYARRGWSRKQPYPLDMLVHELRHFLMDGSRRKEAITVGAILGTAYAEHLARRNEFWTTSGQVTVAILLLIVVTVLLLTRTIEPDAGLPILSGIAGFAIAKGTGASRGAAVTPPPEGEPPQ